LSVVFSAVALIAAAVLGGAPSAPEVEPTACWKALFMDWADGQVGGTYSVACYRKAIAHVRGDRLVYGTAAADLRLLLARSVARLPPTQRAPLRPSTQIAPWPTPRDAGGVGSTWARDDAWRIVLAAVLTALLLAWIVARLRPS
jgi:hypothetical protein